MNEFGDTIPGVIVDDVYEFLTIILFFILEMTTGFISNTTLRIGEYLSSSLGLEEALATTRVADRRDRQRRKEYRIDSEATSFRRPKRSSGLASGPKLRYPWPRLQ